MEVKGTTRVLGVIGDPVEHSISPEIHNTLASDLGDNLIYVPFHVTENIGDAIRGAYALNILGMNVTVPYKNDVIPFLNSIDPLAGKIGAVNTLVREDGGFRGYNTDILGLKRSLANEGISLSGRNVVMIGAGGVARAVAFLCASEKAASVTILNRTEEKAASLAKEVGKLYPETVITGGKLDDLADKTAGFSEILAIQCTSVGLYPRSSESPIDGIRGREIFLSKVCFAFDVIYRPEETAFLASVRKAGGRTLNGLAMLLYQGIAAYELWNRKTISEEEASRVLKVMKESL